MLIIEFIKSLLLGIVEGVTEWLPISSTGHMILFNAFTNTTDGFLTTDVYLYVIQLGAILAIVTLYFKKLNPFSPSKTKEEKSDTWQMWFKVIVACLPAAVIGLLLNDFMENFENPYVISAALIIYGILFIIIEKTSKTASVSGINKLTYKKAVLIGLFQVLSIIPGTSRSGSTILGAMILGCSRETASEFSFFLAIPVMFGVSFLKLVTNDYIMSSAEWGLLITGMITAYIVSMLAVKFLMNYVKKHDFKAFGYYRIILGAIVILSALFKFI
ncbi:MAG: undecaprenyl-diphosphate phosphatase [Clostridia bacterium]|nr:undecaprenyl-diphosphate phosphatase [Clostridia bacterium]